MTFLRSPKKITVNRNDGTSTPYTYHTWTNTVGVVRKADALLINEGKAYAVYDHNPTLKFNSARYYPSAKKWFLKSERSKPQ